jgi:diadenosine tetraphosphate (Ap4A) HIT family hydrolase
MSECWVCELIDGRREVPGSIIAGDEHWVVDHCLGPFGVGAFVLKTKEHRDSLWTLTDDETASLGPWLRRLSQAIIDALGAERVYVTMWVDAPPNHMHFVVWPRYPGEPKASQLEAKRREEGIADWAAMAAAADRVKERLQ